MIGLISCEYVEKFSLKSLSVECSIRNLLVSCKSEFVYKNEENYDIEALFSFPLDNNCVVYFFQAIIGNKTINGVCMEIDEARNLYEAAKEMGHAAAIIERNESMKDVFNCRIGNFPKNSEAKIILKFAMQLKLNLARSEEKGIDRLNLALPLILRPRYTPSEYQGDTEVFQVSNKYAYNFKANITGTKVIKAISSVNHTLRVNFTNVSKTSADVILQSEYDGTKDLDINIDYIGIREPSVFYELGSKSARYNGEMVNGAFYQPDVAMINFLPKYDQAAPSIRQKVEIVFVVDRSGSMEGSNIERARECLLIFIKSLPINCKFQIYGFGSTFDKAFNDSQLYSDQSISIALEYQKNLDANFGGTELMEPLQDLYNAPLGSDYARIVFLLTDGDVGNQVEVTSLVRKHNKTTRLFTVGIGDGVSTSLVDQVAQAGLGKSVFVRNAKELSASVMELLDIAINCNSFTEAKVNWKYPDHVSIVSVPSTIPPLFSDYFLTVFCMINGMKTNDTIQCTLSGNVDDKPVSFTVDINDSGAFVDEEFRVHRLLGKYKIDEMTVQTYGGEYLRNNVIELSMDINIVSEWTTFVAISQDVPDKALILDEPEVNRDFAAMPMMRCCRAPTADLILSRKRKGCPMLYDCVDGYDPGVLDDECDEEESPCAGMESQSGHSPSVKGFGAFGGGGLDMCDGYSAVVEKVERVEKELDDVIMILAQKQNINGSWNYDDDLFVKVDLDLSKVKSNQPVNVNKEIWATIIIYQLLTIKYQAREKEWRLFAKKSKQWIESSLYNSDLLEIAFKASLKVFG